MGRYVKRRVEIEARQWVGSNAVDLLSWIKPEARQEGSVLTIPTLEGDHEASLGDWVIKGVAGEFYPCKPEIFEATYDPIGDYDLVGGVPPARRGFDFGLALQAMKLGAKVARRGWNGKGMWIALTPGSAFEAKHAKCGHAAAKRAVELGDGEAEIELLPHIDMRAADGSMVVGWLASQTDMLATDWEVV
jgi:hypothetical protein